MELETAIATPCRCGRGGTKTFAARPQPFVQVVSSGASAAALQQALEQEGIAVLPSRLDDPWMLPNDDLDPSLVILDLAATGYDTHTLLHIVRPKSGEWSCPLLILSNDDCASAKALALESGAADYMTLPLLWPEFVARVKVQLRMQKQIQSMAEAHARHLELLAGAQKFCMPQATQMPGAKFEAAFQQVHMAGGDFYDVMELGDGQVDYVVADASGHDLSASYWTLSLKTLLSEYSYLRFAPADALYLINRSLIRLLPPEVFFTTVYLRINRSAGEIVMLNGGHPPVIYLPTSGAEVRTIEQDSDVLGCFHDAKFARLEMKVTTGDRLFLLSDGLIESCGVASVGFQKLSAALSRLRAEPLQCQVTEAFANQLQACAPQDDALLMGIEI